MRAVKCFICNVRYASKSSLVLTLCTDGKQHLCCPECSEEVIAMRQRIAPRVQALKSEVQ